MPSTGNRLLDILSDDTVKAVTAAARHVDLPLKHFLFKTGQIPANVHFLLGGVASLVVNMSEGGSAEVGMIGREGVVGGEALMGPAPRTADGVMQLAGSGLRVPLSAMAALFHDHDDLRLRLLQFEQSQINISCQVSACNKLHEAEERLARWLLTAADRSGSEVLPLTQEFLAQMIGSQRTTVALIAGVLQRSGMIEYRRGTVKIVDRASLTDAACDCYIVVRDIVDRLYQ